MAVRCIDSQFFDQTHTDTKTSVTASAVRLYVRSTVQFVCRNFGDGGGIGTSYDDEARAPFLDKNDDDFYI